MDGIISREKGLEPGAEQLYELTGIIVHQGQATAGHYYAFIKDKRWVWCCHKTILIGHVISACGLVLSHDF